MIEFYIAIPLGCGFGVYAGYYNFVTYAGTPKESTTKARFTFIYEYMPHSFSESFTAESGTKTGNTFIKNNNGGWYIFIQQSSILPTPH